MLLQFVPFSWCSFIFLFHVLIIKKIIIYFCCMHTCTFFCKFLLVTLQIPIYIIALLISPVCWTFITSWRTQRLCRALAPFILFWLLCYCHVLYSCFFLFFLNYLLSSGITFLLPEEHFLVFLTVQFDWWWILLIYIFFKVFISL